MSSDVVTVDVAESPPAVALTTTGYVRICMEICTLPTTDTRDLWREKNLHPSQLDEPT